MEVKEDKTTAIDDLLDRDTWENRWRGDEGHGKGREKSKVFCRPRDLKGVAEGGGKVCTAER